MNRQHLSAFSSQHLSDEQMYALLDDSLPSEASPRLHLLSCASCQAELAMLGASLTDLRVATTHLAAARVPALDHRREQPRKTFLLRNAWAASLATASVALAVSLTLVHPHRVPAPAAPGNVAAAPGPEAQVSDEALLEGIQQDLSTSVPPPLQPLEISGQTQN